MLLTESFNIKNGTFKKRDGSTVKIAYIDPKTSESTYEYKDIIKSKFDGYWMQQMKTWGWFLNDDPERIYRTKIQPCLQFLDQKTNTSRDIVKIIDRLIQEVNGASVSPESQASVENIKARLEDFKRELINAVSDEQFKALLSPIIKFRKAQGHSYSFKNAILVMLQDPKATLVKSKGNWRKFNREVAEGAPAICLWIPKNFTPYTNEEKNEIIAKYLAHYNVRNVNELDPGAKEKLRVALSGTNPRNFEFGPYFFDYRFTIQMQGKEDLVGNPEHDIPWFDESGEETEETVKCFNALLRLVEKSGVKVSYVDSLNGARGVSMSGRIELLNGQKKNTGLFNTLTHEFAHELLHQTYIKNNNEELRGYFVGTKEGRGKVEQQAELCAWIVLKNFGYDMPTNINYVGLWGMDETNAAKVFDSVSLVAQYIVKGIYNNMERLNENKLIKEQFLPSGEELANMLGFGEIYQKSKQQEQMAEQKQIKLTEDEFNEVIKESVIRVLKDIENKMK